MPEPWRRHLSELFTASPQDRADWLAAHPLRAILKDKAAGEIRRSDREALQPPAEGAPFRWLFRWQSGGTFANVTLPSGVAFTALRFIEMPDGPMPYCIQFDTDHGTVSERLESDVNANWEGGRRRFIAGPKQECVAR